MDRRGWLAAGLGVWIMSNDTTVQCSPVAEPKYRVGWKERLRVKWQNWKVRKTGRAYRRLTKAMREDHSYAMTWQCNIACVIFDSNICTQKQANEVADKLMAHLFNVNKPTP